MIEVGRGIEVEGSSTVSLDIPCRPEYLALGRLVAGALGTRQGWDEEAISDLKLAVSEVASFFMSSPEVPGPAAAEFEDDRNIAKLRLEFAVDVDEWNLTVSNPDLALRLPQDAFSDSLSERGLGLMVVRALADSVEQRDDQSEGTTFLLRKHLYPVEDPED